MVENVNGKKPYSSITLIDRVEIPPRATNKWWELYLDIRAGIESRVEDPKADSLKVPFGNHKDALAALTTLRKIFAERDPRVHLDVRKGDNGATLYVSLDEPRPEPAHSDPGPA